jgi:hypothetical protein
MRRGLGAELLSQRVQMEDGVGQLDRDRLEVGGINPLAPLPHRGREPVGAIDGIGGLDDRLPKRRESEPALDGPASTST